MRNASPSVQLTLKRRNRTQTTICRLTLRHIDRHFHNITGKRVGHFRIGSSSASNGTVFWSYHNQPIHLAEFCHHCWLPVQLALNVNTPSKYSISITCNQNQNPFYIQLLHLPIRNYFLDLTINYWLQGTSWPKSTLK